MIWSGAGALPFEVAELSSCGVRTPSSRLQPSPLLSFYLMIRSWVNSHLVVGFAAAALTPVVSLYTAP